MELENAGEIQHIAEQLKTQVPGFEFRVASFDPGERTTTGGHGYTIAGVVSLGGSTAELLETVAVLRSLGAVHIDVTPLTYRFEGVSRSVRFLRERLKRLS